MSYPCYWRVLETVALRTWQSPRFLDYLRDGVIVGHHIGHDISTLDAGCERAWGFHTLNRSLDTMDLTLHLERDGPFADQRRVSSSGTCANG